MRNIDTDPNIHLLTAGGRRWVSLEFYCNSVFLQKRLRALSAPAFSTGNFRKILPIIEDSARNTMKWLEKAVEKDGELNLAQ
jgi:hypothetical protein